MIQNTTFQASLSRALHFAGRFQQNGYRTRTQGDLHLDVRTTYGTFSVCCLSPNSETADVCPLLIKDEQKNSASTQVFLQVPGDAVKYSLGALLKTNLPGQSLPGQVTTLKAQALSPAKAFWLRWVDRSSHGLTGFVAKGSELLYHQPLSTGVNDHLAVTFLGQVIQPTQPFHAALIDVAGQEQFTTNLRLFLVPDIANAEILEIDLTVQASMMGNFSLVI